MNDEMIKYKKSLKNKQARHIVNTLSVNASIIVDVLKSYPANFQSLEVKLCRDDDVCVQKKTLLFSCITPRKNNQFK